MKSEELKKNFKINRYKMIQSIIKRRTKHKLEDVKQYYEELETKFQRDKKRLSKRYDEETGNGKLDSEIQYQLDEYFSEENYIIENIFLKTFHYSTIVTVYSLLEISLNDLCRFLRNSKKLSLSLEELRGNGIKRAKLYLAKVCLIDFPESNEWNEILKLNKIRNCIVHAQGDIEDAKSPKTLRNIVASTRGVELENDRFIRIDSEYINMALSNTKKLLEIVYEKSFDNCINQMKKS